MPSTSTRRDVPNRDPATTPQMGCGAVAGEQLTLRAVVDKTVAERIADVVQAIGLGAAKMGGAVAFAAHVERPVSEVSRRVNRADDGKGTRMEPFASYFAFFDEPAFEAAVNHLVVGRGFKPLERLVVVTDEQRARVLAGAVTDKVKRQIERERGWPEGTLDE